MESEMPIPALADAVTATAGCDFGSGSNRTDARNSHTRLPARALPRKLPNDDCGRDTYPHWMPAPNT
jgi:hypothetical protein